MTTKLWLQNPNLIGPDLLATTSTVRTIFLLELVRRTLPIIEAKHGPKLIRAALDTVVKNQILTVYQTTIPKLNLAIERTRTTQAPDLLFATVAIQDTLNTILFSTDPAVLRDTVTRIADVYPDGTVSQSWERAQALFDLIKGPPTTLDPSWRTSNTTALARQTLETRDTSILPILADALQDAGCDQDDALHQLRHQTTPISPAHWVIRQLLTETRR